jgi:hypothetical protein
MRRSQTRGIAGNCSCCLVPALILLAIIVAAVIGVAVVWQSAMPSVFRWDYGDHHHYNAYRDGYEQGNKLGVDYARRGDPEPTGQNLDAVALREADRLHVRRNRGHWIGVASELPLQVRVERAGSKKISCIGSRRHHSATTTCDG